MGGFRLADGAKLSVPNHGKVLHAQIFLGLLNEIPCLRGSGSTLGDGWDAEKAGSESVATYGAELRQLLSATLKDDPVNAIRACKISAPRPAASDKRKP